MKPPTKFRTNWKSTFPVEAAKTNEGHFEADIVIIVSGSENKTNEHQLVEFQSSCRLHAFLDFGHGMEEKVQLLPRVRPQLHVPRPAMAVYWELMIELIAGKMWHMWDWTMKLLFWKVHFKIWRNKRNCEILLAPMLFRAATFWGSQLTLPPAKLQKANRWWGWLKVHHDVGVVWCWKNVYDINISTHIMSFVPFQIHQNHVKSH